MPAAPAGLPLVHLRLERSGLAYARNQALRRATAEWVFFPDDDCTIAPDVLARADEALERLPDASFLSGRVLAPRVEARAASPRVLASPPEILKSMSAGLFVKRTLLEELHGFDERFGVGSTYPSGEESELLFRALEKGARGLYAPEIRVFHEDPFATLPQPEVERRAFEYGRGWGAMFSKHAMGPGGKVYQSLYIKYLARALGGAALAFLTLRPALARRYMASYRGRARGWHEWYLRERFGP
jgi:GT2 family glycosyltransferase